MPPQAAEKRPSIDVLRPTIVAFFPVTEAELSKNGDTNEALADFRFYAGTVREPDGATVMANFWGAQSLSSLDYYFGDTALGVGLFTR
jgi:hypothetical protein